LKDGVIDGIVAGMEKWDFASTECNTHKITDAINDLGSVLPMHTAILCEKRGSKYSSK